MCLIQHLVRIKGRMRDDTQEPNVAAAGPRRPPLRRRRMTAEGPTTRSKGAGQRVAPARRGVRAGSTPRHAAEKVFFPAAAIHGSLVVPVSVDGMLTGSVLVPGLATVTGHAHELLFGFALAVVAGFLTGKTTALRLVGLFALWLAARASFLLLPGSVVSLVANSAFAACLVLLVAPRLLRGAKKLRNRALAPLLIALAVVLTLFHLAAATGAVGLRYLALQEGVVLLATLLLFMGGRIIAPAAAGAIQRAGGHLEARVQPRLEGTLLILMGALAVSVMVPGARALSGLLAFTAAAVALARLLRWRLWSCHGRPDLWCLGIGYAWLVVGLALLGSAWLLQLLPTGAGTHAITVGALGTLASTVMARIRLVRNRLDPSRLYSVPVMTILVAAAALTRLLAPGDQALMVASVLWSMACAVLFMVLIRIASH